MIPLMPPNLCLHRTAPVTGAGTALGGEMDVTNTAIAATEMIGAGTTERRSTPTFACN